MPQTRCGFDDHQGTSGHDQLIAFGPTLNVDIGFDPNYKPSATAVPVPGIRGIWALVDTGATESCIDAQLAATLNLPLINRRPIAGIGGLHQASVHLAQIHVPSLAFTIYGEFAAVDLAAGGQHHRALVGRTFLERFTMVYDGKTGNVTLST
jgi:predicted aspartyl protease